jgi:hypothetical protein
MVLCSGGKRKLCNDVIKASNATHIRQISTSKNNKNWNNETKNEEKIEIQSFMIARYPRSRFLLVILDTLIHITSQNMHQLGERLGSSSRCVQLLLSPEQKISVRRYGSTPPHSQPKSFLSYLVWTNQVTAALLLFSSRRPLMISLHRYSGRSEAFFGGPEIALRLSENPTLRVTTARTTWSHH